MLELHFTTSWLCHIFRVICMISSHHDLTLTSQCQWLIRILRWGKKCTIWKLSWTLCLEKKNGLTTLYRDETYRTPFFYRWLLSLKYLETGRLKISWWLHNMKLNKAFSSGLKHLGLMGLGPLQQVMLSHSVLYLPLGHAFGPLIPLCDFTFSLLGLESHPDLLLIF